MEINNKLILENSKSLNILYVEDDEQLRNSTATLFRNFFNTVDIAEDGEIGYRMYEEFLDKTGFPYDLVISDINMPNMDGLKMCDMIKNLYINQVVIFITAHDEIRYLHSAINLGVNAFLTKPIEIQQLKHVLYTTTQIVSDRKLVQQYYEQIEDINLLHVDKKDASAFSSAKDVFQDLVDNKEKISHLWVERTTVKKRLEK